MNIRRVKYRALFLLFAAVSWVGPALACTIGVPTPQPSPTPDTRAATPVPLQKAIPTPTLADSGTVLLALDPAGGLAGWKYWLQAGSQAAGDNRVQLVPDPVYGSVVELSRVCTARDGGAAGLYQELALDVAGYQSLRIWLVGKVLLEEGGNIANRDPQWFPEGAVQVRIRFLAASGEEREWFHGFYTQPVEGADHERFTQVAQGEWFTYTSPDLMRLPDPPRRITDFRIYGFGWQFRGQVAAVQLIGSRGG